VWAGCIYFVMMIAHKAAATLFDNEKFSDRVMLMVLPTALSTPTVLSMVVSETSLEIDAKEVKALPQVPQTRSCKRKRAEEEKQDADENARVVKRLHVSSGVLATQSQVFQSLLGGCMKESKEKEFTVEVQDETEAEHLASVIKMIHTNEMPVEANARDQLAMLMLADKFGCNALLFTYSAVIHL
jgi:hypothetical protein